MAFRRRKSFEALSEPKPIELEDDMRNAIRSLKSEHNVLRFVGALSVVSGIRQIAYVLYLKHLIVSAASIG